MPTHGRRPFVSRAVDYFLRQDYERRELVVLDDGDDRVADLIPDDPRIRYVAEDNRRVLGAKRNQACDLAQGDVIVHWDDDDWHAPHRLAYQVGQLEQHGAAVCGTPNALYMEPASKRAWLYESPRTRHRWIFGLCDRKSLWQDTPFANVQVGEDTKFLFSPRAGKPLELADHRFVVGGVHSQNTSRKLTVGACWKPRTFEEVHRVIGNAFSFYEAW